MRIGLHTGSIIGGCIGTKALRYDIWGGTCAVVTRVCQQPDVVSSCLRVCVADTYVANRFESDGEPDYICVSETTQR